MRDTTSPAANQRSYEDWSYKSTYSNTFLGTHGPAAPNGRVRTSQFYPSGRPPIASTYRDDYMNFPVHQRESIPFGSSSGYRKNNPHPHNLQSAFKHPNKDYFVWSAYRRLPPLGNYSADQGTSSRALLQQVCQDKTRSTYQQDFREPPYATDFLSRPTTTARVSSGVIQPSESSGPYPELTS